jgi:hypothetical protein
LERFDEDVCVTPDQALVWLEKFKFEGERKLMESVANRYAVDMLLGRWNEDNETPLKFDVDGRLIDGQHRLWAVVLADRPIRFHIHWGVPTDVYRVTDINKPRRVQDVSEPWAQNSKASALARMMMIGPDTYLRQFASSVPVVTEFQEANKDAMTFTLRAFHTNRRYITQAPVQATIGRAYYHLSHEILLNFVDRLLTGVIAGPHETAVVTLRNWLMSGRLTNRIDAQIEKYMKTSSALIAFSERRSLKKLYIPKDDPFPLPEDKRLVEPPTVNVRGAKLIAADLPKRR